MQHGEIILRLTALALLLGFLLYKQGERARKRAAFRRQFQREGEPLNVAPIRPRLAAVRRGFEQAAHAHTRGIHVREELVAAARRKLGHLSFFRDHPATHEGEHHTA
jgi:hypothetical protein